MATFDSDAALAASLAEESDPMHQDELVMAREEEIKAAIAAHDLIGKRVEDLSCLLEEYKNNAKFLTKIQDAIKKYTGFRRIRGDGNCFYRAYLFGCFQYLATSSDEPVKRVLVKNFADSKDKLVAQGVAEYIVEDFWENLMGEVKWIEDSHPPVDQIVEHFSDQNLSDYLVSYARLITSSHLKTHAAEYTPFLPPGYSVNSFVAAEVEPMGKECDYVQCVALAKEVGLGVRIEYLDQSGGPLNSHILPEGSAPHVHLLYRPGHYDVLYPR